MPSCYAHYRFGNQVLLALPADVRGLIERNLPLFHLGLQGPDFFFYYRPGQKTPVKALGQKFHCQTGAEFFSRVCRELEQPAEAELAYLYGLLGHYCLDTVCHPRIHKLAGKDERSHNRMESEFDRFLLKKDGVRRPHFRDRGAFIPCSKENCRVAARFYPGTTEKQVWEGLWSMRLILGLLVVHPGAKRVLNWMGGAHPGLLMENWGDPACKAVNDQLMALYEQALEQYPGCLEQLQAYRTFGKPFGKELEGIFG